MKIAGDITSMDATWSYTEVNSFSLGLQTTNMQAPPLTLINSPLISEL